MDSVWSKYRLAFIAIGVLVVGFLMSAFVVNEEEQVVIVQTGEPIGTINTAIVEQTHPAGLYFRFPILQSVRRIERRV
ncbi:MAG: protease modulator HflC, partial [Pseudomonadota bacterium]